MKNEKKGNMKKKKKKKKTGRSQNLIELFPGA